MREVKFRAIPVNEDEDFIDTVLDSIAFYTKEKGYDGTFIYGHLNGEFILGEAFHVTEEYYQPSYWIRVDRKTIGQYTGLKDINKKEIYEGDIFKNSIGKLEKVVFNQGAFKTQSITHPNANLYLLEAYISHIEVIGNIYKNPELLEVKKNE